MHRRLSSGLASLLLLLVGWLEAGCGGEIPPPTPPLNMPPALAGPTVETSEAMSGGTVPLTLEATDPEGEPLTYAWTQVPAVPAGSFSSTTVASPTWTAPEVTEATAFQLEVTVTDSRGGMSRASVTLQVRPSPRPPPPPPPPPPLNRAPVLTEAPQASSSSVTGASLVQLSSSASDADGDPLTYVWVQEPASPEGTFSSTSAASPTWTSPVVSSPQRFTLKVMISDGRGGSVQGQVDVEVAPPAPQNRAPQLTAGPSASPAVVSSPQSVTLGVSASDADGDPLSYAWVQEPASPAGAFSSTSVASPTWTAPVVSSTQHFTLKVMISDGRGGSAGGQVDVEVMPPPPPNQPPKLTAGPSASPAVVEPPRRVSLAVTASDADGDPLTYAWVQEPASPAGTFSSTSVANPTWTPPRVTDHTGFQLHVTVSDGRGGSDSGQVTVVALAHVYAPTEIATSRGCTFTIEAQEQPDRLPPYYDYIVTRRASETCPYPAATTTVASSYTSHAAITGNDLGLAIAYTSKGSSSGSYPVSVKVEHRAPDTLGQVRSSLLACFPEISSVSFDSLFMPDGTTVQVDGTKGCQLYDMNETGSGGSYHAYYYDFFTTMNPPTVVAY